jgi:hypothetical protein
VQIEPYDAAAHVYRVERPQWHEDEEPRVLNDFVELQINQNRLQNDRSDGKIVLKKMSCQLDIAL